MKKRRFIALLTCLWLIALLPVLAAAPTQIQKIGANGIPQYLDHNIEPTNFVNPIKRLVGVFPDNDSLAMQGFGNTTGNLWGASGTASTGNDSTGTYLTWTTAASSNAGAGGGSAVTIAQMQQGPKLWVHLKTGATTTNIGYWLCLATGNVLADPDPGASGKSVVGLRFDTSTDGATINGSTTFFKLYTAAGTTGNVVTSTQTIAASTEYTFLIDGSAGTSVSVYCAQSATPTVAIATTSTKVPAAGTNLFLQTKIWTEANSAAAFKLGTVLLTSK